MSTQSGKGLSTMKRMRTATRSGFTLLEAAITLSIVTVGVLAMMDAQSAFVRANLWSNHSATGGYLADELREMTVGLPKHDPTLGFPSSGSFGPEPFETTIDDFDDLDDFDGLVFGDGGDFPGPVDAFGRVIPEIDVNGVIVTDETTGAELPASGWTQEIMVTKVEPFDSGTVLDDDFFRIGSASSGTASGNYEIGLPGTMTPPMAIDEFPLRVEVRVTYTPEGASAAVLDDIATSWIVP
ncbi:MAG: hypothetical protein AAF747_01165 [Planctomycetota bacterium]